MLTTLGIATLITGDIASKTVNATINILSSTLSFMTTNCEDLAIKKYKDEIESIDIHFKLNIIQEWLNTNKGNDTYEKHKLYESINSLCQELIHELEKIDVKIKNHTTKWFRGWRSLDLENEIFIIKKKCLILNERLILITCIQTNTRV